MDWRFREGSSASFTKAACYFRTDPTPLRVYRAQHMKPFTPNARQTLKNYYEVPVDIVHIRRHARGVGRGSGQPLARSRFILAPSAGPDYNEHVLPDSAREETYQP